MVQSRFNGFSTKTTVEPTCLKARETTWSTLPCATANDNNVGGTSISSKVPDIESFPPILAKSSPDIAKLAPNRDKTGLPQRSGSFCKFSKNSWKDRRKSL